MSKDQDNNNPREKRGYMALRNNVKDLKLDLWKEVRPLEYFLIDVIIDKTIAWRQKTARITIKEFMERSGQKHPHVYMALKALETKGVIIREKHDHRLYFGLSEEYFGKLLIKKHEEALQSRRSKIKVVVDNSKSLYEKSTAPVLDSDKTCANLVQTNDIIRTKNSTQHIEIIKETNSLNTLLKDTPLNTSLKDSKSGNCPPLAENTGKDLHPWETEERKKAEEARDLIRKIVSGIAR